MLQRLEYLPREHLIAKFTQLTGMSNEAAERLAREKGMDVIVDYIEVYLSMPPRQYQNRNIFANKV